jgi:two-component system, OmpR family, sensor histidine kinase MtrB
MRYVDWRSWLRRLARWWSTSLQLRVVTITIVLSSITVSIIGAYMSYSIGNNLYEARRAQSEDASARATVAAQDRFDALSDVDSVDLDTLLQRAFEAASQASSRADGGTKVAILGFDSGSSPTALSFTTPGLDTKLISTDLQTQVRESQELRSFSQSIAIPQEDGSIDPGLVIGSVIDVSSVGPYGLYIVNDLADTQATLDFVQQTLLLGGMALIVLIGAVTYIVVRLVVGPVRVAAQTSERFAAGELEARIPEHGEDVIATLARSFNGMAASLQQQITRLATLSKLQQRFVSDVSHELRTPLTTIRLAGDVLYDQRESFTPTTARTSELLHAQIERFELLLADLLEMSRYDAGAVEMEIEPSNIVRLVEQEVVSVEALAESKGSELRLVAPGGYFEADIDRRRIRRIVQNLLGNAIDHGEAKPIVVWVDSDKDAFAIAVRDYGVGMSQESVARVFDRFWRADPSRQRSTGGTGLGLAIALEDAVLHDGLLEVWSAPGEGSCFRLTIPRMRGTVLNSYPLDLPPDLDPIAEVTS